MKRLVLIGLMLTGCATTPSEPRIITKEVKIPVPVPCRVELPQERPLPSEVAPLSGDVFDLSKLALMDREELKAQREEWRAAAKACAE